MDRFVSRDTYVGTGNRDIFTPSVACTLSQDHLNEREGERGACTYKSGDQSVHITITRQDVAAAGCTGDPMDGFDCVCPD